MALIIKALEGNKKGNTVNRKDDPRGRAIYGVALRPLGCWDCRLESRRRH